MPNPTLRLRRSLPRRRSEHTCPLMSACGLNWRSHCTTVLVSGALPTEPLPLVSSTNFNLRHFLGCPWRSYGLGLCIPYLLPSYVAHSSYPMAVLPVYHLLTLTPIGLYAWCPGIFFRITDTDQPLGQRREDRLSLILKHSFGFVCPLLNLTRIFPAHSGMFVVLHAFDHTTQSHVLLYCFQPGSRPPGCASLA